MERKTLLINPIVGIFCPIWGVFFVCIKYILAKFRVIMFTSICIYIIESCFQPPYIYLFKDMYWENSVRKYFSSMLLNFIDTINDWTLEMFVQFVCYLIHVLWQGMTEFM